MWLGGGNGSILTTVRTSKKMSGEGTYPICFFFSFPPTPPCHFNPADHKKWVRLLALPLQLSCVGFFIFLLGNGTAFTGTKRNEITFNERKRPHYSHQQQLLTATLPINKEHLRVWLLDLWTWSNLLALISFFWAQTLGAHSYRFGGLIRTENWTEWGKALTFNHYQLGLW